MDGADGRYGYRAWDRRPGDGVDPSVLLDPVETIAEIEMQAPMPPPAGVYPRFTGVERTQLSIADVLQVGPTVLMRDQDAGMPGTLRS